MNKKFIGSGFIAPLLCISNFIQVEAIEKTRPNIFWITSEDNECWKGGGEWSKRKPGQPFFKIQNLAKLKRDGLDEDTIVIYMSDHG